MADTEHGPDGISRILGKPIIWLSHAWRYGPSLILPPSCRFSPSCSAYMIEAVTKYGPFKGGWMGVKRLLRCHPWGGCGHDPVP